MIDYKSIPHHNVAFGVLNHRQHPSHYTPRRASLIIVFSNINQKYVRRRVSAVEECVRVNAVCSAFPISM